MPLIVANLELPNLSRAADVRAAREWSTSANALFTAAHERVILDVARAYFRFNAARTQLGVSRDTLERTRATAAVERSEAERELAQAEYNVAQAQPLEIAAYATLVSVIGIDPAVRLDVAAKSELPIFTAGVSFEWLLYDGGLRQVQTEIARSQHDEAVQSLVKLENQVVQEVISGYHEADESLSRYRAATALYDTALVAEDAATKS